MAPMDNRKRGIEVVDLTNDDESKHPQPHKVPRAGNTSHSHSQRAPASGSLVHRYDGNATRNQHSSSSSAQASSSQPSTFSSSQNASSQTLSSSTPNIPSQAEREQWVADNEADADEVVLMSQDDNGDGETFELYGTLSTKIVGVRYYNGVATLNEHVLVRREPSNPYDSNAIRVDNVTRVQIGHLPRTHAAKLAKYVDDGSIVLSGVLIGEKGYYECPVAIRLYGPSDPAAREALTKRLVADKLPLDSLKQREREEAQHKKEELKKVTKSRSKGKEPVYAGTSSQSAMEVGPTMEEIMLESERFNPREMGEVVEKFGVGEDDLANMPMAEPPKLLLTTLLPYQRQGLAWLLDRENPQVPAPGSKDVVQLWKRSPKGDRMFTNIATNFTIRDTEPTLASGGILADDMGLGKTLQIISLIAADPYHSPGASGDAFSSTTLIVAPLSVMSNWSGQIAAHIRKEKALKVLVFHGTSKQTMKPKDFAEYDVVITTYGTLASEFFRGSKNPPAVPRTSGLFSMKWRRIVLDEGHNIRNPTTKGAQAACGLMGKSKWVLTGTPIINNLKDLYSLVKFIGLTGGLEKLEIFNSVLIHPLKAGMEETNLLLQALMGTLCLRRKKEMSFVDLKLPPLTEYVHRIKFLPHEREKYHALQMEAKGLLKQYQTRRGQNNGKSQDTYRHILEVLLRLRQVCNHWKLCGERITNLLELLADQKVVELNSENRKALQEMLRLNIESREDCPVCLEDLESHRPVITHCAHAFGFECITRVIETQHKCPLCRAELKDQSILVEPAVEQEETTAIDVDTSSSKVEALLDILKASRKKDPTTKTVVFSQWTKFLDIVQRQLEANDFKYTRIDGTMNTAGRDQALIALDQDPDCTVMLASLGVCAVGLNLVAANQAILADSWWAPAIEMQAVDRIHRLGQLRETTVFRLVMDDSIEDTVLEIQQEKQKLMMTAFREKSNKRAGVRLGDIQRLLQ